ncbi:hypothetical protein VVD49_05660 [Uliginosibacterium sp. H3]|uniref:Tetratricopeptide repeat protein n=1 Tax=Uliginosibacterium silvisoli TaxID=3114758 RepID=A0ABU6K0T2_9RHOO|nr:hypothetical protein [Uliginosibacterium sp. H3]
MTDQLRIHEKQAGIAPFQTRLPFLFGFPLKTGPMVFLACITLGSVLAGVALGSFAVILKGTLAYLSLRYAFNLLDLFSLGRFESESPDMTLTGTERRPAKFGLVLVLFIAIAVALGSMQVAHRVESDPVVRAQLQAVRAAEEKAAMEAMQREAAAYDKRIGIDPSPATAPVEAEAPAPEAGDEDGDHAEPEDTPTVAGPAAVATTLPVAGEAVADFDLPQPGDALWFRLQPVWYWLVVLALSLMLPAAVIVIALEDKFFKALNPANLVSLLRTMGANYFILWACCLLLVGGRQLALSLGADWAPWLRFPAEMAIAGYLGMVLFCMIGYVLYQYHQELGLEVTVDFDGHREREAKEKSQRDGRVPVVPDDPLEARLQPLLARGKVSDAVAELRDFMRYDKLDPKLNTRMHQLHMLQGDDAQTLAHGQVWIQSLARAGLAREAYDAHEALLRLQPEFVVESGDAILCIARGAWQARDFKRAGRVIQGFDKRFPKHRDTPAVLFLAAQLSSEYLRQHDHAIRLLQMLIRHYPDAEPTAEARTYLQVLERVAAQGASAG